MEKRVTLFPRGRAFRHRRQANRLPVLTTKLCIIPLSSSQIHDSRSPLRDTVTESAFCWRAQSTHVYTYVRTYVCVCVCVFARMQTARGNRASIRRATERFNDIQEDPFFCHRVSLNWPDKESLSIGAHDDKIVTRFSRLIYRS